ncbi:MAG: type IV toxin-antitoxin system AbiEi family antitoxin [Desulfomonilia bacterium]
MDNQTLEDAILQNAAEACTRATGIKLDIRHEVKATKRYRTKATHRADALLSILHHGKIITLEAEIRNRITTVNALLPLINVKSEPDKVILVTPQVTARMADRLRAGGIQFMDEAGNVYLNQPPLYLFVKGNKNLTLTRPPMVGRAFKQTGLQLLFVLLCNKDLLNKPFRTIAAQAGVAFGVVNWTMRELKELGFLEELGTRRNRQTRLIKKEALLERWVTGFAEQLRPKLVHGRYQGTPGWWNNVTLDPEIALWGGEVAAAKLTKHLKPQDVILYVDRQKPNAILAEHKLKKDPLGNVMLLYRFWKPDVVPPNKDMVHPLLVYADLMATGDQRNLETARMIYERYIVQLVRED